MQPAPVRRTICARIPTPEGVYQLCHYVDERNQKEHLALLLGDIANQDAVLARVHSECFTGDVLGSQRCDCGEQLHRAMRLIAQEGAGVILYLRQEGRGIGLLNKVRAYALQDRGLDTVDANLALGFQDDERDYRVAAHMLMALGVRSVRLLTNNPDKVEQLEEHGIVVSERLPHVLPPNVHNLFYLQTKATKSGHAIDLGTWVAGSEDPAD